MHNSTIKVQLELTPGNTIVIGRKLDGWVIREAMQPLDYPAYDAGMEAVFCTSSKVIQQVTMTRKELAKKLSEELTEALLDVMESQDTFMGYPK